MNIVEKIYCRVFQTCFRIAMPILPYRNPEVLASEEEIAAVLTGKGVGSVLIVTDEKSASVRAVEELKEGFGYGENRLYGI